jgi:hypothetical protein
MKKDKIDGWREFKSKMQMGKGLNIVATHRYNLLGDMQKKLNLYIPIISINSSYIKSCEEMRGPANTGVSPGA